MRPDDPALSRFGYLFAVSSVLNTIWLFAWHWESLGLSVAVMVALLVTLMLMYNRLSRIYMRPLSLRWWCLRLPFSIYFAWISVATIANVSVALYAGGWEGGRIGEVGWTVIMSVIAALLAGLVLLRKRDFAFTLVIIWALTGVGARNQDVLALAVAIWCVVLGLGVLIGVRVTARRPVVKQARI